MSRVSFERHLIRALTEIMPDSFPLSTNLWSIVMQIYPISQLLSDAGFRPPELRVLNPNFENYSALLLQPQGDIEADASGVRNANRDVAGKQYKSFLSDAANEQSALAITPEYSVPWQAIEESLKAGVLPAEGALWVLGCESIRLEQLAQFRDRMTDTLTVLYEPLDPQAGRFLDPVLYLFASRPINGNDNPRYIGVVQFKTSPMGDKANFEVDGLQLGERVYSFGNGANELRLATLVCSDAFAVSDQHARELYHGTLLIHIQLNKSPRQAQYRLYRDKFMQYGGDETEILCLNWAKDVYERIGDSPPACWNHLPCSAWYLRPDKYDDNDATLTANHRNGLYYTWLNELRCHALFFAYGPAVFGITASKVAHRGVMASQSRRRGPILNSTRIWDEGEKRWIVSKAISDGFENIVGQSGDAANDIRDLALSNPFGAERALALCAGQISEPNWYSLKKLDSCQIDKSEVVRRITACQDVDPTAQQFRTRRLRTAHRIVSILKSHLPAALADLQGGFKFDWSVDSPHTNIISNTGRRATTIYLGDDHAPEGAGEIEARAADHIGDWEQDPNAIVEGRQRLHVWYRDDQGNDVLCDPHKYVQYDESHTESPFDIGRAK